MRFFTTFFMLLFVSLTIAFAQSPIGKWKTIDDVTGLEASIVEFYEKDGKLYGKVLEILQELEDKNPVCWECSIEDDRYHKPVIGLEIVRGLENDGNVWKDGTVLDPLRGKVYDCKLWLEDENTLMMRGYIFFFYRTQTWYRVQ